MSDQRLRFKLKNIIQEYNADRKMRQSHESSRFRPNPYQLFSHFKHRWAISHWVPAVSIRNDHITNLWRLPDSLTIREQRILMEQVSLCIYYMLIAVSCLHCPDAIYQHDFSVNHICEQHMRIIIYLRSLVSPLLFAVERPLPFINCFWSVLVLTDPDQIGVTGFV